MDRKLQILLITAVIISAVVAIFNMYAGGIVAVCLAALIMTYGIMQDSANLPDLAVEFRNDAKAIIIRNVGNAPAHNIHIALVPENIEFDIASLDVEVSQVHEFGRMVGEIKVITTFENNASEKFSRTFQLSSRAGTYDPLKPMIPLFRWK